MKDIIRRKTEDGRTEKTEDGTGRTQTGRDGRRRNMDGRRKTGRKTEDGRRKTGAIMLSLGFGGARLVVLTPNLKGV